MKIKRKSIIILVIVVAGILIIWNTFSIGGIEDLKGDFKETAFYRNENNIGPIRRIYAVTLSDTLWDQMEKYGDFMPHTKYGNTKVYFFRNTQPFPTTILPEAPNFGKGFEEFCIGVYEKESMGNVTFEKYPFKK